MSIAPAYYRARRRFRGLRKDARTRVVESRPERGGGC